MNLLFLLFKQLAHEKLHRVALIFSIVLLVFFWLLFRLELLLLWFFLLLVASILTEGDDLLGLFEGGVFFVGKHAQMVLKHFLGEAFENPLVLKCLQGRHPVNWIPVNAASDKVQKRCVISLKNTFQSFGIGFALSASGIGHRDGLAV